jgi:hypothetical protein
MVRLSDYIAPEFLKLPTEAIARENIVVYNPAKARRRTTLRRRWGTSRQPMRTPGICSLALQP